MVKITTCGHAGPGVLKDDRGHAIFEGFVQFVAEVTQRVIHDLSAPRIHLILVVNNVDGIVFFFFETKNCIDCLNSKKI